MLIGAKYAILQNTQKYAALAHTARTNPHHPHHLTTHPAPTPHIHPPHHTSTITKPLGPIQRPYTPTRLSNRGQLQLYKDPTNTRTHSHEALFSSLVGIFCLHIRSLKAPTNMRTHSTTCPPTLVPSTNPAPTHPRAHPLTRLETNAAPPTQHLHASSPHTTHWENGGLSPLGPKYAKHTPNVRQIYAIPGGNGGLSP